MKNIMILLIIIVAIGSFESFGWRYPHYSAGFSSGLVRPFSGRR